MDQTTALFVFICIWFFISLQFLNSFVHKLIFDYIVFMNITKNMF